MNTVLKNGVWIVERPESSKPMAEHKETIDWLFSLGFGWVPWEVTCDHDEFSIELSRDVHVVVKNGLCGLTLGVRDNGTTVYFLHACEREAIESFLRDTLGII